MDCWCCTPDGARTRRAKLRSQYNAVPATNVVPPLFETVMSLIPGTITPRTSHVLYRLELQPSTFCHLQALASLSSDEEVPRYAISNSVQNGSAMCYWSIATKPDNTAQVSSLFHIGHSQVGYQNISITIEVSAGVAAVTIKSEVYSEHVKYSEVRCAGVVRQSQVSSSATTPDYKMQ